MSRGAGVAWLALLLGALAAASIAQPLSPPTPPVSIERAEFVASTARRPPGDEAAWEPVTLPDNWHRSRPGASGAGWYRIVLPVERATTRIHAIYLPRDSAPVMRLYVNGTIIGSTVRPDPVVRLHQQPYVTGVTPDMIRDGRNLLHVYVEARSDLRQGLTRVWFGDSIALRTIWAEHYKVHVLLVIALALMALTAGIAALALWARTRRDAAFFWFGQAAILIAVPTLLTFWFGSLPTGAWRNLLQLVDVYGYMPPLAIGALALAGVATRVPATLLWGLLLAACAVPWLADEAVFAQVFAALGVVFVTALAASFMLTIRRGRAVPVWLRTTVGAAIAVVVGLAMHDLALWLGWIDFDRLALFPFAAPALALSLGALLVTRHFEAVHGLELAKSMLEARVAERTLDIEHAHEHLRALEQEQATIGERQRIMADMHDGLGASLVGLLGAIQAGKADRADLEQRAHGALQELRLAVDSLDTPPGDLNMALGTVRHRLRDALEASGVELDWQVAELPQLAQLTPSRILQLQRIVIEALTNALRHARAKHIVVTARADAAAQAVEVSIADDGRGMNGTYPAGGRGLMIMQRRASTLGGRLEIATPPGGGTCVTLWLPIAATAAVAG